MDSNISNIVISYTFEVAHITKVLTVCHSPQQSSLNCRLSYNGRLFNFISVYFKPAHRKKYTEIYRKEFHR